MRTIPELKEGTHRAKASGILPSGQPVVVNADGTVSVVEGSDLSVGTPVDVGGSNRNIDLVSSTFDSNSNKVVVAYRDRDGSFYGTAIVGTVSGSTISFGTPVVFLSATIQKPAITFDSSNNKIIIAVYDGGSQIATYVGTVSGSSISFGSRVNLPSAPNSTSFIAATFDSNSNKVVLAWQDQSNSSYGTAIVGTVSGTSISYGSFSVFESASTVNITATFDSNANKVVISYKDNGNSGHGTAVVGTVSGTSISFGTPVVYNSSDVNYPCIAFDSVNNKVVVSFADNSNSYSGTSMVGTVSGTSISFGAKTVYYQGSVDGIATTFDSTTGQIVTLGRDSKLAYFGTVSGTTISYNSSISFSDGSLVDNNAMSIVFDNNSNKIVTPYRLSSGDFGKATVVSPASINLTSENYIGMSQGVVIDNSVPQAVGTPSVFNSGTSLYNAATFDSNSNKVVISYADHGNSGYGTAVVGTVSGNSISFGTPVVYLSASTSYPVITFDSNSNKVVVAYRDGGASNTGKARVGTVSGTSISFGTEASFFNATANNNAITFDSNSNKVVIAFRPPSITYNLYLSVVVGTVSGTNISFGSRVVAEAANCSNPSLAFDSNSNKVVLGYRTTVGSNAPPAARVGTVSGTTISFGSQVVIEPSINIGLTSTVFDSNSNKIAFSYIDGTNGGHGKVAVGTVSGTSISFGSVVTFSAADTDSPALVFDSVNNKIVLSYVDDADSDKGEILVGTISGTSISFESPVEFTSSNIGFVGSTFDSNAGKVVTAYRDTGGSDYGRAVVFQVGTTDVTRGQVASGSSGTVDIIGSVSTNQSGLTAGQSYYVQTDGTIGETAASPSVFAGTAISATSLVVKT